MACESDKYVGREVPLEFFIGCGDVRPDTGDYLPIGALRTKEGNGEYDTVDATADDTIGNIREMLATYLTYSISADGTSKKQDGTSSNQTALYKHFFNPSLTGGQPLAWFRLTYPDVTVEACMLLTAFNRSNPYDELSTFSIEATSTVSAFGVIVEDTPVVP